MIGIEGNYLLKLFYDYYYYYFVSDVERRKRLFLFFKEIGIRVLHREENEADIS